MATQSELAEHLGVTVTVIKGLIDRGIIPRSGRGGYDLRDCLMRYISHLREQAAGRGTTGDLVLADERARLAKEQADAKEMENAVLRGDLVYIADVAKEVEGALTKVRAKLLAVPNRVAPECHASATVAEVQSVIDAAVREALLELHEIDT